MPMTAAEMKKALKTKVENSKSTNKAAPLSEDFFRSLAEPSTPMSMQQDAPYASFRVGRRAMSSSDLATIPGLDRKETSEREREIAGLREFGGVLSDEEYEARWKHIYRPSRNPSKK